MIGLGGIAVAASELSPVREDVGNERRRSKLSNFPEDHPQLPIADARP
jgi:hypothetical protein